MGRTNHITREAAVSHIGPAVSFNDTAIAVDRAAALADGVITDQAPAVSVVVRRRTAPVEIPSERSDSGNGDEAGIPADAAGSDDGDATTVVRAPQAEEVQATESRAIERASSRQTVETVAKANVDLLRATPRVIIMPTSREVVLYAELRRQIALNRALVPVVATALFVLIMGTATLLVTYRTQRGVDVRAIYAAEQRADAAESRAASVERRAHAIAIDAAVTRQRLSAARTDLSEALSAMARLRTESSEQRTRRELSEDCRAAVALAARGEVTSSLTVANRALDQLRSRGDRDGEVDLLRSLADALLSAGATRDAEALFARLLLLLRPDAASRDRETLFAAHLGLASALLQRRDLDSAARHALEALALSESVAGDRSVASIARAQRVLVEIRVLQQRWNDARQMLRQLVSDEAAGRADDLAQLAILELNAGNATAADRIVAGVITEKSPVAPPLLRQLAHAMVERGRYASGIALLERALSEGDPRAAPDEWLRGADARLLARLYVRGGHYAQAEALYKRIIGQREQDAGVQDPDLADCAQELGELYERQAKYGQAEALYKLALQVRENSLGANHPDVARSATTLADLYQIQGRLAEAAALSALAQSIRERALASPTTLPAAPTP